MPCRAMAIVSVAERRTLQALHEMARHGAGDACLQHALTVEHRVWRFQRYQEDGGFRGSCWHVRVTGVQQLQNVVQAFGEV